MVAVSQLALVILFKEVHRVDPEKIPLPAAHQLPPASNLATQQPHHGLRLPPAIGDDENDVIRASARS